MNRFAHIVNPVKVNRHSDLFIAQPITFDSMKRAREFSKNHLEIEFYSAHYKEDLDRIPDWIIKTPDLDRSVLDLGEFAIQRKLPLLKDILQRLYDHSTAEYLIYTNVDIALQPHFYHAVNEIILQGYDAMVVNRRTISSKYTSVEELPLMYTEKGIDHPGLDCFIFHRDLFPKLILGESCIGATYIGLILSLNLAALSRNFKIFTDLHLTFHIGDNRIWQKTPNYSLHNYKIIREIFREFEKQRLSKQIYDRIDDAIDLSRLKLH